MLPAALASVLFSSTVLHAFNLPEKIIEAGVQATLPLVEKIRALNPKNCRTQALC
ncbi:MAG: hypothetical protein ACYDAI_18455 [Trichloromonadaceae bacterium]